MKTIFPTAQGFSASYVVGERRHPMSTSAQRIGSFILKREYTIDNGNLVPSDVIEGLQLNDITQPAEFDKDSMPEFVYTLRESDLSVFKPEPDIIVLGYRQVDSSNSLRVTQPGGSATLWYERIIGAGSAGNINLQLDDASLEIPDVDANTNLLGWQPRQVKPRLTEGTIITQPADPEELRNTPFEEVIFSWGSFNNRYFNAYRRDFYKRIGLENEIDGGAVVDIERSYPLSDPSPITSHYTFSLENLDVSAKIYLHDGRGADKPARWCCKPITDIHLDTLIVKPENHIASAIWRGVWDFNQYPVDNYRQLEVKAEVSS